MYLKTMWIIKTSRCGDFECRALGAIQKEEFVS